MILGKLPVFAGGEFVAKRKVLVVVDVQVGIFQLPVRLHDEAKFLASVGSIVDQARAADIPIVFVQHSGAVDGPFEKGTWGWQLHPRLRRRAHEPVVEKSQPDAFIDSNFEAVLNDLGGEELYMCGFATPFCFDSTVRTACSKGYDLVVIADGHTTTDTDVLPAEKIIAHHNFVFGRFARVIPSTELVFHESHVRGSDLDRYPMALNN